MHSTWYLVDGLGDGVRRGITWPETGVTGCRRWRSRREGWLARGWCRWWWLVAVVLVVGACFHGGGVLFVKTSTVHTDRRSSVS